MRVVLDLETVSAANLKDVGARNYANHDSTQISVLSWKRVDGKVHSLVHPRLTATKVSSEAVKAVGEIFDADKLIAHNAPFECAIMNSKLEEFLSNFSIDNSTRNKIRKFKLDDFTDTMTLSLIHRGPASLKDACPFFELPYEKDTLGQKVMKIACKLKDTEPKIKKTMCQKREAFWVPFNKHWAKGGPNVYSIMQKYCEQDVIATEALYKRLISKDKIDLLGGFIGEISAGIKATNAMNENGVNIDIDFCNKIVENKNKIEAKFDEVTLKHFGVDGGAKREAIKRVFKERGIELERLGEFNIREYIRTKNPNKELSEHLLEYSKYNKAALKKAEKALALKDENNKIYDMFKFCGASENGRWASYGVQLQNLPRPKFNLTDTERFIASDECPLEDPDKTVAALRAALVPSEGKQFFVADLKQIEFRVALWLAGYKNRLEELESGVDLYKRMAASYYKISEDELTSEQRQLGKTLLLAAQYGQGPIMLRYTLAKEDVHVSEQEANAAVDLYRQSYKQIVSEWRKYDRLLREHIGRQFKIKLPTGRYLDYGKIVERTVRDVNTGMPRKRLFYKTGKKYKPIYGSIVWQHLVSASARDIMLLKINSLHEQGHKTVMTVHDEVVVEINKGENLDKWRKIWDNSSKVKIERYFKGLPIESDCSFTHRYFK